MRFAQGPVDDAAVYELRIRDQDVDIIKNVKGNTLDPSQSDNIMTAKMIIDATRPVQRPFEARVEVPKSAMENTRLENFIARAIIDRMPKV